MNILILGGGGREHALAWAVSQNPKCDKLIVAPGNAGIAQIATCATLNAEDPAAVVQFAEAEAIDLVIIGPEAPLAAGVADRLREAQIPVFGPNAAAARLEASKSFTKEICDAVGAPTAAYARFTDAEPAKAYIREQGAPIVVKADGLAAGKGVIVAMEVDEALAAIDDMFGGAHGEAIVVFLFAVEVERNHFGHDSVFTHCAARNSNSSFADAPQKRSGQTVEVAEDRSILIVQFYVKSSVATDARCRQGGHGIGCRCAFHCAQHGDDGIWRACHVAVHEHMQTVVVAQFGQVMNVGVPRIRLVADFDHLQPDAIIQLTEFGHSCGRLIRAAVDQHDNLHPPRRNGVLCSRQNTFD